VPRTGGNAEVSITPATRLRRVAADGRQRAAGGKELIFSFMWRNIARAVGGVEKIGRAAGVDPMRELAEHRHDSGRFTPVR